MSKSRIISGFGGICLTVIWLVMLQLTIADQRICGPGLRKAAAFMCPYGFNGYKTKRSSAMREDDEENNEFRLDMLPYFRSMESNGLAKIRRRRHGLSHECCDKPCSMDELKTYCKSAPDS